MHDFPLKCQCVWNSLGCSFLFQYQVLVGIPYVPLADCCTGIKYLANVMTVLNSSFCQFIEYQDAHANCLTESTDFILNSVCNFTTFGKELPIGSAFLVFS